MILMSSRMVFSCDVLVVQLLYMCLSTKSFHFSKYFPSICVIRSEPSNVFVYSIPGTAESSLRAVRRLLP